MRSIFLFICLTVLAMAEKYPVVIYVTTTNAPSELLEHFFYDVSIVISHTPNFQTVQVYRGIDEENLGEVVRRFVEIAENNATFASALSDFMSIGIDTDWLDMLHVADVAPVYGLAECEGEIYPENCAILTKLTGDISLRQFLILAANKQVAYAKQLLKAFGDFYD
jgi:hypothetical protein